MLYSQEWDITGICAAYTEIKQGQLVGVIPTVGKKVVYLSVTKYLVTRYSHTVAVVKLLVVLWLLHIADRVIL